MALNLRDQNVALLGKWLSKAFSCQIAIKLSWLIVEFIKGQGWKDYMITGTTTFWKGVWKCIGCLDVVLSFAKGRKHSRKSLGRS